MVDRWWRLGSKIL